MLNSSKKVIGFVVTLMAALMIQGCEPAPGTANSNAGSNQTGQATGQATGQQEPTIEATPVQQGDNNLQIATGDTATLNVNAPGAKSARILYRPMDAGDRVVALKKTPTADNNGRFTTQIKLKSGWKKDNLRIVVFVQERKTWRIIGVATTKVAG